MFNFWHFLDKIFQLFQGYVSRLNTSHNLFRRQSYTRRKKTLPNHSSYIQFKPSEHLQCKHEDNITLRAQFLYFHQKYQFRDLWPFMEVNSYFTAYLLLKLSFLWWKSPSANKEAYKSQIIGCKKERKKASLFFLLFWKHIWLRAKK